MVRSSDDAIVVSPEGTVLRRLAHACDRDEPRLSRSGNWAGVFCKGDDDSWAYSVVSTTTDKVYRLKRPWGTTFALTDDGDSIFLVRGEMGIDVVFWPKEDEQWKPTNGAPPGRGLGWSALSKGKSQVIARKATAVTLLGKELFFVQADGKNLVLKAVALPETKTLLPDGQTRR
jgi:hypothetical protein